MEEQRNFAGIYPRMLAHNIDLLILLPFFYLIGYFVSHNFLLVALCSLLYIFYHTLFEVSTWHGTPGKKLQKIAVNLELAHKKISSKQAFIRNAAKVLSAVLFFSGFIMVAFDKKKRSLHDRMAGTVVFFIEK